MSTKLISTKSYNSKSTSKLLTTNIQVMYITLFLIMLSSKLSHTSYKHVVNNAPTVFILPIKNRKTIFLRAPYKNKLARLNIVNIQYKFLVSVKVNNILILNKLDTLVHFFTGLNFSSYKIQHTKTKVNYDTKYVNNYLLSNYN